MNVMNKSGQAGASGLETYVIRHGKEDAPRLNVLAAALAPSTTALLDRLGSLKGKTIVDAGCGGGDVTVELARRTGPEGHVIGLDADGGKLDAARELAANAGITNCIFIQADLLRPWPVEPVDIVYARFFLTHLPDPETVVAHAHAALAPGGMMVIEDIDCDGCFSYPPSEAYIRACELYVKAARLRGCDPCIGQRLDYMLEASGFAEVEGSLAHPYGRSGPAKDVMVLTVQAIADAVVAAGLIARTAMNTLIDELVADAARLDMTISMPRVFQAWGVKQ